MHSFEPQTLESSRYKCLAEAVIIQAIKDATRALGSDKCYRSGGHLYSPKSSADGANHFLLVDAEVFPFWCEVAGLVPAEVRSRLIVRLRKRRTFDLIRALHRTRKGTLNEK